MGTSGGGNMEGLQASECPCRPDMGTERHLPKRFQDHLVCHVSHLSEFRLRIRILNTRADYRKVRSRSMTSIFCGSAFLSDPQLPCHNLPEFAPVKHGRSYAQGCEHTAQRRDIAKALSFPRREICAGCTPILGCF